MIMKSILSLLIFIFSLSCSYSQDEVLKVADEMPRVLGCEEIKSKSKKQRCAEQKLLNFIYANIEYPKIDQKNKIEGRAITQFVVTLDGKIQDVKIIKSLSKTTDKAIHKMYNKMNDELTWRPGHKDGKAVKVLFTFPIQFKLEKKRKK